MNTDMNIQLIPVGKLKPAKYNPRKDLKPGDPEYEKIKRSLKDFGYVDPIIWNEVTGNIVGGHQRYKILKAEGATELHCVVVHIENENDEKALNIALNKASGEWDEESLIALMQDLNAENYDLTATAFSPDEIAALLGLNDEEKEAEEDDFDTEKALELEPFVEPDDIWLLGRHRLMCGDSTIKESVARLMDGKKANACITDPPYNVAYEGGTGMKIMNDHWDDNEKFYQFLFDALSCAYESVCDGGALYVFHSDSEKVNFFNATVNSGWHYSTTCIWVKNSLIIGRMDYQMKHEPVIYAFKDTKAHAFYGDRKQTTVWEFDKPTKSKLHPTTKPLPLIAYPMKMSTQENGYVLDLFGGSGSTLITAEQLNRTAFLMELDPKYASAIVRRYIALTGNLDDVRVIRNGEELPAAEVHSFTELELDIKDGSVWDVQKGEQDEDE